MINAWSPSVSTMLQCSMWYTCCCRLEQFELYFSDACRPLRCSSWRNVKWCVHPYHIVSWQPLIVSAFVTHKNELQITTLLGPPVVPRSSANCSFHANAFQSHANVSTPLYWNSITFSPFPLSLDIIRCRFEVINHSPLPCSATKCNAA